MRVLCFYGGGGTSAIGIFIYFGGEGEEVVRRKNVPWGGGGKMFLGVPWGGGGAAEKCPGEAKFGSALWISMLSMTWGEVPHLIDVHPRWNTRFFHWDRLMFSF